MRKLWMWIAAASLVGGPACSGEEPVGPPNEGDGGSPPVHCLPGEEAMGGECVAAGVPAAACAPGFQSDGAHGCAAVLPSAPCPAGMMALPGATECREIAPCGEGRWGEIPIDGTTQYVDGSHAGSSNGSEAQPWTTIQAGIDAASDGGLVAVAAGSYAEDVQINSKRVRLWGRCPQLVEVVGQGDYPLAIGVVYAPAAGSEVHQLAVRGPAGGAGASQVDGVLFDRLWIHDTGYGGFRVTNDLGPAQATLSRSLVENVVLVGIQIFAAHGIVEDSVVRHTRPWSDGTWGRGVQAQNDYETGEPGSLALRRSVIAGNLDTGVLIGAIPGVIEDTLVRDTRPEQATLDAGRGIGVQNDEVFAALGNLVVRRSVVEQSYEMGISVAGSMALVEDTVVRDVAVRPLDGLVGRGIGIQSHRQSGMRSTATVRRCLVERAEELGLFVGGSDALIEATRVRDVAPQQGAWGFGWGIGVQLDWTQWVEASAIVRSSVVEQTHALGIGVVSAAVEIDKVLVRDVMPQVEPVQLGDGIAVLGLDGPAIGWIRGVSVERPARAGITAFGAIIELESSKVHCAPIALNGEPLGELDFAFEDRGGNDCGCEQAAPCAVLSSGLTPPDPVQQ